MNKRDKAIVAFFALLFFGGMIWAFTSAPKPPKNDTQGDTPKAVTYEGNELHINTADGKPLWELKAAKMAMDVDTNNASMEGIEATFYGAGEGRIISLRAASGAYDAQTKDIKLTGGIQATVKPDETQLTAQSLQWENAQGILATEGAVRLSNQPKDVAVTAERIETNDAFQHFKATGTNDHKVHLQRGQMQNQAGQTGGKGF